MKLKLLFIPLLAVSQVFSFDALPNPQKPWVGNPSYALLDRAINDLDHNPGPFYKEISGHSFYMDPQGDIDFYRGGMTRLRKEIIGRITGKQLDQAYENMNGQKIIVNKITKAGHIFYISKPHKWEKYPSVPIAHSGFVVDQKTGSFMLFEKKNPHSIIADCGKLGFFVARRIDYNRFITTVSGELIHVFNALAKGEIFIDGGGGIVWQWIGPDLLKERLEK